MSKDSEEATIWQNSPWIIVLVGPNGAGKTTFYKKFLSDDQVIRSAEFINCDNEAKKIADIQKWREIRKLVRSFKLKEAVKLAKENSDPSTPDIQLVAAKNTLNKIQECIDNTHTFMYETTGSGRSHINVVKKAKDEGYRVATIFIGLSSSKLSQARVHQRITEGGHSVPLEDIERRYPKTLVNLPDLLKISDLSVVFDNSSKEPYKPIFLMNDDKLMLFDKYPRWLQKAFTKRNTSKEKIHISTSEFAAFSREEQLNMVKNLMLASVVSER